jgi:hypothetical protein
MCGFGKALSEGTMEDGYSLICKVSHWMILLKTRISSLLFFPFISSGIAKVVTIW